MEEERKYLIEFDTTKMSLNQLRSCIAIGLNPLEIEDKEAIEWLLSNKCIDIIKLMGRKNMIDAENELSRALSNCSYSNDIELAIYLLDNDVKPKVYDVIAALDQNHIKLAKILILKLDDEKEEENNNDFFSYLR